MSEKVLRDLIWITVLEDTECLNVSSEAMHHEARDFEPTRLESGTELRGWLYEPTDYVPLGHVIILTGGSDWYIIPADKLMIRMQPTNPLLSKFVRT